MLNVCVERQPSQEGQPSPPLFLCPQLALPMSSDVILCVDVCVCVCEVLWHFQANKRKPQPPSCSTTPQSPAWFTATGCGRRGRALQLCQPGLSDCFQRRDTLCLLRIAQWVWFEEQDLNLGTLGHLLT